MSLKSFKEVLDEAVSSQDIHIVSRLIKNYLTKRVGKEFFQYPGVETYIVGGKTYTGVRFFYGKTSSVRFNWLGKSISQAALESITVWKDKDNKFDVEFDHNVSLVKVLPYIVPILKNPHATEFDFVPVDESTEDIDISEMSMMNTAKAKQLIQQHTQEGESLETHKSQIAERIRRKIGARHVKILDHDSIRHESEFVLPSDEEMSEALRLQKSYDGGKGKTAKVYKDAEWNDHIVKYYRDGVHQKEADSHHYDDKEDAHSTAQKWVNEEITDEQVAAMSESCLNESEELAADIRKYLAKMGPGDKIGYREVKLALSRQHFKLFQVIVETNPHVFDTSGKSPVFIGNPNKIDYARAIQAAGGAHVKVTRSVTHEQPLDKTPEEDLEDQATKLSYKEKVSHLTGLVKLLKSGATNALFVAGEGGTGKTFTVEEELAKQGLKDGDGYFKNTGSTSTAALYETLYKYRKEIVLFDDCDAVFGDQDSRNILKSATDTKAKRKVAYNKKGSSYYDPAFQAEPDDDSQLPKYFDFEGKIIFISNLPMKKLDPDGALRTRGFFVELSPSNEEMLEFMGEILGKIQLNDGLELSMKQRREVLDFVREGGGERANERISLRKLVRALNVRASFVDAPGDEWKTFVKNYS